MFSVPKPLKIPDSGLGLHNHSASATTPFPLHLSVTTPDTSKNNGDWGFKRPLPLRQTTKSSTPVVRVKQVDSIEAITDYASASDHSLTLDKFHEMNVAISAPVLRYEKHKEGKISVFEDSSDKTTMDHSLDGAPNSRKWKFAGPWLASMSEEQFSSYIDKRVRSRRLEFRDFLRQRRADDLSRMASQAALDSGVTPPSRATTSDVSDADLADYIRSLRADRTALYWLVSRFLDLAPVAPPQTSANVWANSLNGSLPLTNPYAQEGPPICHPSAGISYLRTSSFLENHPLYGPQKQHSPVLSRILSPQRGPEGPKLGIGGFVTNVPPGTTSFFHRFRDYDARSKVQGLSVFDPSVIGGASVYLIPQAARVLWNGSVVVKVDEAAAETQLIKREFTGRASIYTEKRGAPGVGDSSNRKDYRVQRSPESKQPTKRPYFGDKSVLGSSKTYGLRH